MAQSYGRRHLCNVLHAQSREKPDQLFAIVAQGHDVADGFHQVTYQQVAQATNFMSHKLQDCFDGGQKPIQNPCLCYMGLSDIRYNIMVYAALQCGYKIFLASPRNAPDVNIAMLQQLNCSRVVYAQEVGVVVAKLKTGPWKLQVEQIPSVEELLNVPKKPYSCQLDYDQSFMDPAIILHSSGSTGIPKTITWTHGTLATIDARDLPDVDGRSNVDWASLMSQVTKGAASYDVLPPFHAAGVVLKLILPIWFDRVLIFAPASRPPSGALMAQILRQFQPAAITAPPSIFEQLLEEGDSKELLQKLELAAYGGGPLSDETALKLAASAKVVNIYASTECVQTRQLERRPGESPNYIRFNPHEGYTFEPYGDGLYELVMPISKEQEKTSGLYHNLPHLSEFHTKDVFQRHPTDPELWKFQGRIDDILVFSSGEKVFALPMETALTTTPNISGALVVGHAQRQSGLLIELAAGSNHVSDADAIEQLWPVIEAANALLPAPGRVSRDMIVIAKHDKPFIRTVKGTVVRRSTEKLYEEEIRALYIEQTLTEKKKKKPVSLFTPSGYRYEDVQQSLRSIFQHVLGNVEIGDDQNLYNLGMDSIKTAEVVNQVRVNIQSARPGSNLSWLNIETLYSYPSLSRLSAVLLAFLNDGKIPEMRRDRLTEMKLKVNKYTANLPTALASSSVSQSSLSVAVTGTTGFLGHYLVDALAAIPQISRIYCLNRSPLASKQYHQKGKSVANGKEVVFMTCNFGNQKLGLSEKEYSQLLENCCLILHNAWTVNFGLPLDAFEDNISSVRQLIDLSAAGRFRPRIHFISSFATTGLKGIDSNARAWIVPEAPLEEEAKNFGSTTPPVGYAEAKRVSERILEIASKSSGVPVTIIRLGQLVPEDGHALPATDNLTLFLKSCRMLQSMPRDLLGDVNWIPVDIAAGVLADVVHDDLVNNPNLCSKGEARYFNLVNPNSRSWEELSPALNTWCGDVKLVSAGEWMEALASRINGEVVNGQDKNGLIPQQQQSEVLLRVWREFLRRRGPSHVFECDKLKAVSRSMQQMDVIRPESLASWLPHIDV